VVFEGTAVQSSKTYRHTFIACALRALVYGLCARVASSWKGET